MSRWASTFIKPEGKKDSLKNLAKPHSLCVSKESSGSRLFSIFDTFQEFIDEYRQTPEKTFFECIRDKQQKIYFDIDVDVKKHPEIQDHIETGKNVVVALIKACIQVAKDYNYTLVPNDFAIFSSNGATKVSYHVITYKHKVLNNKLNKLFFEKTMTYIEDRYHQFLDPKMYSSFQQFRMVGSTKEGANRTKLLVPNFRHKDIEIVHKFPKAAMKHKFFMEYYIIEMSLITRNDDCKIIPIPLPEDLEENKLVFDSVSLTEDDIAHISLTVGSAFEVRGVEGNLVSFVRTKPTKCIVCMRYHNSDNPYVTVVNGTIRLHCHRAKNEFKDMGYLPSSIRSLMPKLTRSNTGKSISLTRSVDQSDFSSSEYDFMRAFDE